MKAGGINKIYVVLSDWCPACMEYKVVLNYLIAREGIAIDFSVPDHLRVDAIPTTVFETDTKRYRYQGFMTAEEFLKYYYTL